MELVFGQRSLVDSIVRWLDDNTDRWALDVVLQHSKRATFPRIDHVPPARISAREQLRDWFDGNGRGCHRWLRTLVPAVKTVDGLFSLLLGLLANDRLALAQCVHAAMSDAQRQSVATDMNIFSYDAHNNRQASHNAYYIRRIHALISLETIKYYWTCACAERQRREILQGLDDRFLVELMVNSCAPFTTVEWFLGGDATFMRVHGKRPSNVRLFGLAFAGGQTATIEYYWRRLSEQERFSLTTDDLTLEYGFDDNEFSNDALIFPLLKEINTYVQVPARLIKRLCFSDVDFSDVDAVLSLFSLFEELSDGWADKEYLFQLVDVLEDQYEFKSTYRPENERFRDSLRGSLYALLLRRIAQ